ncbi:hypothetical protein PoB_002782800 [Plakobranchus ocellatus]|uniref:Uncharacterized protein n=1 Tax=Plakobranchus ocellatus TaxID=259542 RepID=A0AAV4A3S2_9GAST|nr:hypothetical protein PoB_002782800 [Plakobranchus ocellatus]
MKRFKDVAADNIARACLIPYGNKLRRQPKPMLPSMLHGTIAAMTILEKITKFAQDNQEIEGEPPKRFMGRNGMRVGN